MDSRRGWRSCRRPSRSSYPPGASRDASGRYHIGWTFSAWAGLLPRPDPSGDRSEPRVLELHVHRQACDALEEAEVSRFRLVDGLLPSGSASIGAALEPTVLPDPAALAGVERLRAEQRGVPGRGRV